VRYLYRVKQVEKYILKRSMGMKKVAARIARNQNIHFQPAYWDITPPRIGPSDGARMLVREVMPIYIPRSAEVATSATTALAIATVPEDPPDWTIRRMRRAT
jgi:hypothetical protein